MEGKLTLARNIMHSFLYCTWTEFPFYIRSIHLKEKRQNNIAVLQILMESSSQHTCALDFYLQSCYSGSS